VKVKVKERDQNNNNLTHSEFKTVEGMLVQVIQLVSHLQSKFHEGTQVLDVLLLSLKV